MLAVLAALGAVAAAPSVAPRNPILDDPRFGAPVRERLFLRPELTSFNHGSFGTVPRDVMAELARLQELCEDDPDRWIQSRGAGEGYRDYLEEARSAIAAYVGADAANLVFVENASGGCNAFMRSLDFGAAEQPKVLYLSSAYGMVKSVADLLEEEEGVELVEVEVSEVIHDPPLLLATIEAAILANGGPAAFSLAVISHIASIPGVILPVEAFIDLLPGVPVMIDGAHAPGTLALDLEGLRARHLAAFQSAHASQRGGCGGCASYIGNMHKWLFAPKGTAFLWVSPEWQAVVVPPVLSGCRGDFLCTFEYTGTRDYTPFATVPAGLAFRESVASEAEVMEYGHALALWSGEYIRALWGTDVLEPPEMTAWMTNVRWPTDDSALAGAVSARLLAEYNIRFNVYGFLGQSYTRLSAQIYLTTKDVERVGGLVLELLAEGRRCKAEQRKTEQCAWARRAEPEEEGVGVAKLLHPATVALTQ